jgi:hypothetical protein
MVITGNKTQKTASSNIREFVILKAVNIQIHPHKAALIKEVLWSPPKVNTHRVVVRNPAKAAYGGIFRDYNNVCHGFFSQNIITYSTFIAQITGTIKAIEIAAEKNCNNLWLETDSQLVLLEFKSQNMVP